MKILKKIPSELNSLNKAAGSAISSLLKNGDFTGKLNETTIIPTDKKITPKRILLVGLGKPADFSLDKVQTGGRYRHKSGSGKEI